MLAVYSLIFSNKVMGLPVPKQTKFEIGGFGFVPINAVIEKYCFFKGVRRW